VGRAGESGKVTGRGAEWLNGTGGTGGRGKQAELLAIRMSKWPSGAGGTGKRERQPEWLAVRKAKWLNGTGGTGGRKRQVDRPSGRMAEGDWWDWRARETGSVAGYFSG